MSPYKPKSGCIGFFFMCVLFLLSSGDKVVYCSHLYMAWIHEVSLTAYGIVMHNFNCGTPESALLALSPVIHNITDLKFDFVRVTHCNRRIGM